MSNSYMKSPGAGVHPLFPITPGKDKGMTPMLEDLGTERRSTRKLFPQRSPLKSAWKELRAKAQSRRNIRVLLILAILATFYGIFELNFQTFSVWYKIADRFPGDKEKLRISRPALAKSNDSKVTQQSEGLDFQDSKNLGNKTQVQAKDTLKTLNFLHMEVNNLTKGILSTESELERLNFEGKTGAFGGHPIEKSTHKDSGEKVDKVDIEDGYEEKNSGNENMENSGTEDVENSKEEEKKSQNIVLSWEEAYKKILEKIPQNKRYLWETPPHKRFSQCLQRSKTHKIPVQNKTNGYLMVTANGGLNQMRSAICDMVAVTRIMNATLVIPGLDHTSFWNDTSEFEDIFDADHFIEELKNDVRVVKQLPDSYGSTKPYLKVPISWSSAKFYRTEVLPLLKKVKVIYFPLTDSRLANNDISTSIQRVRCRANYRALKHTKPIENVSNALISRLREMGPYIGLHLRYEKDMLAFTGCAHGLQPHEAQALKTMRLNNERWKEKEIDSRLRRKEGACPLTPRETALFLRAMGYPNRTVIYIAAGDIYGSSGLKELVALYPHTYTHASLATKSELDSLGGFQNRHAAVDYEVAFQSNVFVATFEGNMAKTVQGHRRFEGHRRTLIPDRKEIVNLVDMYDSGVLSWSEFRERMKNCHIGRDGSPVYRVKGSNPKLEDNFFANPLPGCICENKGKR